MQQTASVTHPHAVVTEFGRGLAQFDQRLILDRRRGRTNTADSKVITRCGRTVDAYVRGRAGQG